MPNNFTKKFPIVFKNPFEMLCFYDNNINDGKQQIYPWQIKILEEFALDIPVNTLFELLLISVIAANGSGKSQFILAPCAVWLAISFDQSLGYVTSSSASQLDTQTERFIDMFSKKMNDFHRQDFGGEDIWKTVKRKKFFKPTESHVDLFATDEAEKAEGKHPLVPGGEFAIFVDEGKSIAKDIYEAIDRCNGATRRLDISSPGVRFGHFYEINTKEDLLYSTTEKCQTTIVNKDNPNGWRSYKIVANDCPHIRKAEIDRMIRKHGLHDPLVRSSLFAEFTSTDESVIVTRETIEVCDRLWIGKLDHDGYHGGLDLTGGGDEMVLSNWIGNIQHPQEYARLDTVKGEHQIILWLGKYKSIGAVPEKINADDGGIGNAILNSLADKGYHFNRVLNNRRAADSKRYRNLGTENWFNFIRLIELKIIKLLPDKTLRSQLANRYFSRELITLRLCLESKEQARANGHPSPDRADAAVLAWYGIDIDKYIGGSADDNNSSKRRTGKSLQQLLDEQEEKAYEGNVDGYNRFSGQRELVPVNCSLEVLVKNFLNN